MQTGEPLEKAKRQDELQKTWTLAICVQWKGLATHVHFRRFILEEIGAASFQAGKTWSHPQPKPEFLEICQIQPASAHKKPSNSARIANLWCIYAKLATDRRPRRS